MIAYGKVTLVTGRTALFNLNKNLNGVGTLALYHTSAHYWGTIGPYGGNGDRGRF